MSGSTPSPTRTLVGVSPSFHAKLDKYGRGKEQKPLFFSLAARENNKVFCSFPRALSKDLGL